MRHAPILSTVIGLFLTLPALATDKPQVVEVWPGKVPDETGGIGAEYVRMSPKLDRKQVEVTEPTRMVTNVTKPTLTIYRPAKEKDCRAAVLICPGGGYWNLYWELEGEEVATWLNSLGVTGIILKYRVPRRPDEPKGEPARRPLQDAQRAVRLVRSKAKEWGIDPKRIGMIGFSAGGHLAIATATSFDKRTYEPIDDLDKISCRPDFAILAYPGYLKAKDKDELAPGLTVPTGTPPIFLVHGDADLISEPTHSVVMYQALKRAGVSTELHIYAGAAHDFGVRPSDQPCSTWTQTCEQWLGHQGFLKPKKQMHLQNSGFEQKLDGWSVHVYGPRPQIDADDAIRHEGKRSLRITTAEPSDTALGQEVQLHAGRWYRFRGWVRTRGLQSRGASLLGTFQVQLPGGHGVLASGLNHSADTDWSEEVIGFRAPADGRARLAVFFAGFGRGTGTAWFDDLKLEEVDPAQTPVKVTRDFLCPGEISPLQYGQFIEYLCDLVPGMWAEKLHDGSFEGLTPYKVTFLKETDFRAKPWYPCGAVNRAEHTLDNKEPVSGAVSRKIAVPAGSPCTVGVAQDGIAVERDKACHFSCWLRQQGIQSPVKVRLHHEGTALAACEFKPGEKWTKYSAKLVPTAGETNATLTIEFRGPGTLWIDNASLMPEETVGGWRQDVVEAVRALKPGVIRFGGSALDDPNLGDFEWRDTIGDLDRRKPFRAWGGLQPTGPGLEEIVQFCRHVGAEPLLCVRVRGRSPKDAADQVEYFNGGPDTPLGKLRARNGHPQPYGIKYWQVGNEREGADYEKRLAEFCKAMKSVDPSIKLFSSYPRPGVLRQAGDLLDYVCPHHYECEDLAREENDLLATRALCRSLAPDRPIKIAVTEWNTTGGDWGPLRARLWTLENALACSRYHNLLHRRCDWVEIANRSNLINSFCSGIIQTDNHRLYKTPTYYAQQLYANQAGNRPLKILSALPPNTAPDVSATLTRDGEAVVLFAVNPTLEDITRPLDLSAFGGEGQDAQVWTLADRVPAGEPDAANSFADPQRIRVRSSRFRAAGAKFDYCFPALSLTVLRWCVKK